MKPFYKKLTINHARGFQYNIKERIYTPIAQMSAKYFVTPEPVPFSKIGDYKMSDISVNGRWGKRWDCAWFRFSGTLPDGYKRDELVLMFDLSGEACVFDDAGCPLRGLTNINSDFDRSLGDPGKRIFPVNELPDGKNFSLWVEAGCNDLFGIDKGGVLLQADIAKVNTELRALYYDYVTLLLLCESLTESDIQHYKILYALEKAQFLLSSDFLPQEISAARKVLEAELGRKPAPDPLLQYYAIGHAHMDLAWLWPIRETRRKVSRTFSSVIANMENYPDYIFGASQPQQLQWMKEDYPELYKKFITKVKEGRIEAQGAMWVEPDTNITGGESLVRQILYGKKFFLEECGAVPTVVWLPDVFGFTAALPQIMKKSGVDNFVTIKLSWSEFNKFPHNTFWWEGADGSKVLVHMPPELNYNGAATPQSVKLATDNFAEKGIVDKAMIVYGIGDGGGGPNRAHLERLSRMKNVLGIPPIKQATSEEYFADLRKNLPPLRTHKGEMYLERHQGTYTTQARNKLGNRRIENALRTAEYISVLAKLKTGFVYPAAELERIWKEVLLYQFHDILPGSSIKRVYDESVPRYEALLKDTAVLTGNALRALGLGKGVLNMSPFARREVFKDGGEWFLADAPAMSIAKVNAAVKRADIKVSDRFIENENILAEFDANGRLIKLIDKATGSNCVLEGNRWQLYNDFGDGWDMNINYRYSPAGVMKLASATPFNDGCEAGIKFVFKYNDSVINQTVSVKQGGKALEFFHKADWKENGKMLRAEFDTEINTHEVTCDIQFGSVKRNVNKNYSQEFAQYEICAHKWLDLSREDFGIAIVNDCKYGYSAEGNKLSINILRSTNYPGENADKGEHSFAFALVPHKGRVEDSDIPAYAYGFNNPLKIVDTAPANFLTVNRDNIVIEAVKQSESGENAVIRMYENRGVPTDCILNTSLVKEWCETDMTEKPEKTAAIKDNSIPLKFTPFEIKTILVK